MASLAPHCAPPAAPPRRAAETRNPAAWIGLALAAGTLAAVAGGCQWASSGHNATGARYFQQGQYTAAQQEFQKAIVADPQNPDSYYNMAATYHQQGKQRNDPELLERAEGLYNQCLDHSPDHVECHRGLAVLLVDSGRPDRAFALMKNWASRNPTYAEPRIELARLYEEHGEPQTALKYLEDAVQQDANNPRAWLALGRLRENQGDPTQALQNYQRAYALNNMQPQVSERIAALSRQLNASRDAKLSAGGTQIASPLPYGNSRY